MTTPPPLQTNLVHAAAYSSLYIQVLEHMFPERKLPALSDDERRIVANETDNLLTRSKWRLETFVFANTFGIQQQPREGVIPADTVLGVMPTIPQAKETKAPGQYV
jgi:hypothetical protein